MSTQLLKQFLFYSSPQKQTMEINGIKTTIHTTKLLSVL